MVFLCALYLPREATRKYKCIMSYYKIGIRCVEARVIQYIHKGRLLYLSIYIFAFKRLSHLTEITTCEVTYSQTIGSQGRLI